MTLQPMDLATLIVGIASFVVSALPLLIQTILYARGLTKYERLQKSLEDVSRGLTKLERKGTTGWSRVTALLEAGDVIMPHVVARFWRRLPLLLGVALGTAVFSGGELDRTNWLGPKNVVVLFLLAGNWVLALSNALKTRLLSKDEIDFLRNFSALNDLFYKNVVLELVEKFNARCRESITVSTEQKDVSLELEDLKQKLIEGLQAPKRMLAKKTSAGLGGEANPDSKVPAK